MTEDIIEGNKLIAEFIGMIKTDKETGETTYKGSEKGTVVWTSHLQYHFSWDWLMPVVEKIEKKHEVEINNTSCVIYTNVDGYLKEKIIKDADKKIEAVWLAVVEFIKWYNQNQ